MTNILEIKEDKTPSDSSQGERVLGALLGQVRRWQKKASTRPEEIEESVRALQSAIQAKTGRPAHAPKMNGEELFAFITNPAHFNEKERNLVRSLFNEVLRLKKKMTQSAQIFKGKKKNKSYV